jgi:protocatechuate 3,4-dioxygenase beta subunit
MGFYSDVRDRRSSTTGKKFLRGYQVTDANGLVRFTTIYPGWYEGRAVHIHFKVRADPKSARAHELTSQFYFDESLTDRVHARAPYTQRGQRRIRNEEDGLFRSGGSQLLLPTVEAGPGYAASFDIALKMA